MSSGRGGVLRGLLFGASAIALQSMAGAAWAVGDNFDNGAIGAPVVGDNNTGSGQGASVSITGNGNSNFGASSGLSISGNNNTGVGINTSQTVTGSSNVGVGDSASLSV